MPKRRAIGCARCPRATYAAVALISAFYAFSTWAIVQHYGPSQVQAVAAQGVDTFVINAVAAELGPVAVVILETLLIISLVASILSFHNAINRYFFALGRERVLPRVLSVLHVRHGSPYVAGLAQTGIVVLVMLAFVVADQDPYAVVFSWTSAFAVIGILVVQFLVCVAVIAFFRRDSRGVGVAARLVCPVIAMAGLFVAIVQVILNLPLLVGSDSPLIWSFPVLVALTGFGGYAVALRIRRRDPARYHSLGHVLNEA